MVFENLIFETRAGIGYLTLNRPDKLNTLNRELTQEVGVCLEAVQKDDEVKAVIIRGAGEKAFAAGADITELIMLGTLESKEMAGAGQKVFELLENLGKPVIAAINGYALGAGCELAMACTIRIATETARFGQPEVRLGVIPGHAGTQRLPRLVGKGRALEMLLTGDPIDAQEAYRIGLVNHVVPTEELMPTAERIAKVLMANAPLAIKFMLEAVNRGLEMSQPEGESLEADLFALCYTTEDLQEGMQAFLEKRQPKFKGK